MSEPQAHETGSNKGSKGQDKAAAAKVARTARLREQMLLLTAASFCTKPHHVPRWRPTSHVPEIAEQLREAADMRAQDVEGDRQCPDCQRKLNPPSAGLLLAILPTTATAELLAAAKRLRSDQPMVWSEILRMDAVALVRVLRMMGKDPMDPGQYQDLASEAVSALMTRAPAA